VGGVVLSPTVAFTTLNADAYDAGDVLAATQEVADAVRFPGGTGILQSLLIVDGDDQAAAITTVYIFQSNVALGTEDSAVSITDANALEILGIIVIAVADWTDLINSKAAFKSNLGIPIKAEADSTSIYIALQTAGTPTQTSLGMTGRLGILAD
jgi:hypothetical protein